MTDELRDFVRDAITRGLPRPQIRDALLEAGWRPEEVDAELSRWAEVDFPIPVPRRRPYLSAREAFLYLVMFATLYVTAFNVGATWFAIIDDRWPDPARFPLSDQMSAIRVRGAAAALLIAFPIFLFLARHIGNAIRREPEKRGSRIRKWLTYLTLFVAALVLIGDLIVLAQAVLAGELATRFLLKVATVFAIAGAVFGHYLADLRRDESESRGAARAPTGTMWLSRAAVGGVLLSLAAGLTFVGSPQQERIRQIDARRVRELQAIAGAIDVYWEERASLPPTLHELAGRRTTFVPSIVDPITRTPYEYRTVDSTRYELCAEFSGADTASTREGREHATFWRHEAGRHCYPLEISRIRSPYRP